MPAIGFGQKVTGGGNTTNRFAVTSGEKDGPGTLDAALKAAKSSGQPAVIEIAANVVVKPNRLPILAISNLTITGVKGAKINTSNLYFDCAESDNVLIRNLIFEGNPTLNEEPKDSIRMLAENGRGPIGFWIDHCRFDPYFDLNITVHAADHANDDPLLLTISSCRFFDPDPDRGTNNGAMSIAGVDGRSTRTNAYATVVRNAFETVRRRSPRTSGFTVVHAFNNVLVRWGSTNPNDDQSNGMSSGHDGILVAQGNFFRAGVKKQTIEVTPDAVRPGRLTIDDNNLILRNEYRDGADRTPPAGAPFNIGQAYAERGINPAPQVQQMTDTLRDEIQREAGPQ